MCFAGGMKQVGLALTLVAFGCSSGETGPLPNADPIVAGPVEAGDDGASPAGDGGSCTASGGDCRDDVNACCNGTTCVFDTTDLSKAVCATTCLQDSQCNSGCCTVLIGGSSAVCAPAKYCASSCVKSGGDCAPATGGPCCASSVCVTDSTTDGTCAARCANGTQCSSGCCAPLSNTRELVCSPIRFCP